MKRTNPGQNGLLAGLSQDERKRLRPHLERVAMPLGAALYESGQQLDYAYFPTDCIVALLYTLENGDSAEIAVVGNEGVVGICTFMGGHTMSTRAVVQSAGSAYRLPAEMVLSEFKRGGQMQDLMLRYTQTLITQMTQTAVCNRHHSVDQQLCRWLLLSIDRLASSEVATTQNLIARMLGVRRESVTEAAGKLQRWGIIKYKRGHIAVLDRPRLEEIACECYEVVRRETAGLPRRRREPLPPGRVREPSGAPDSRSDQGVAEGYKLTP